MLHGHSRSLTKIKYNKDGDLLFSASKDVEPNVWYSHNGEHLGSYQGHSGSIWSLDVNESSDFLITGSADNTVRLWDVQTGQVRAQISAETGVRHVEFSNDGGNQVIVVTDAKMGKLAKLMTFSMTELESILCRVSFLLGSRSAAPLIDVVIQGSRITCASWSLGNKFIYTGHEDGSLCTWDAKVYFYFSFQDRPSAENRQGAFSSHQ